MFNVELISIDGKQDLLEVVSIIVPTSDGNRTILSRHMDVIIEIVPGVAKFKMADSTESYFVSAGILTHSNNKASLIVDAFESENEIDFKRAHHAYEKAHNIIHKSHDTFEIKKAELAIKRALGRLRLQ